MNGLFDLTGKRALVTGASSGLGEHFAQTLAAAGAQVVVAARRVERLEALVACIAERGGRAQALALDVCDAESVRQGLQAAQADGGLDIIVNNAGVSLGKPALEQSEADWDHVIDTNLKGCWLVATEGARHMRQARRGGSIVNIASILGERVAGAVAPYAVSKAGVLQLTRALALELARHDIRVNALAPGYVSTELNAGFLASEAGQRLMARIPQRRFAEPRDLDGALLLLASEAGRAITGATLAVDGGHLVSSL
ncbi:SDR family oxidoreductase [Pseudomonas sp. S31]|uniref:SDR family NAD(P)-dependent oxidoreductase n=1 Tax=Pseudomonas sp. S31 TaxID=1564473 RepID=UPI0019147C63|nr:SDR family NAD(P)-dependent oxidoreductase [Pseudomonas sp. S31]MBK4998730.1 SDR family oxidoreductase [Pseudomonas sp. S31]